MEYAQSNQAYRTAQTRALEVPADSPGEASRIRDGITNAEQALSGIHEQIGLLEKRLDTVLRPIPPQGNTASTATPQPICSHVTGRLNILNEGFAAAAERLRELRERVEV